jgi:hypothetical protein
VVSASLLLYQQAWQLWPPWKGEHQTGIIEVPYNFYGGSYAGGCCNTSAAAHI